MLRRSSILPVLVSVLACLVLLPAVQGGPLDREIGPAPAGMPPPVSTASPDTGASDAGEPSARMAADGIGGAGRSANPAESAPGPSAPSATPENPIQTLPPTKAPKATTFPPIVFYLAKGEPGACGPGCAEWIAADGMIDFAAPQRLRALFNRLGRRNLPIFFHSPGGSVSGALAIGRLLRERGLTAGVGSTVPQGCDPKLPRETACEKLKRSGRDLQAQLDIGHTMCNSACVYALMGAAVRQIPPGAGLGIHSSSFSFVDHDGHALARPSSLQLRTTVAASYARIAHYFGEMGIDPALLTAARQVANDHIRFLSRAEIWRFNIDRRTLVESGWTVVDEPMRAIRKVFVFDLKGGHDNFRTALIHLSCSPLDRLRVDFAREAGPGDDATLTLAAGNASRILKPRRRSAVSNSKMEFTLASTAVPPEFFLKAGGAISISPTSDQPAEAAAASEHAIRLSTAGLDSALAKLLPSCGRVVAKPQIGAPASASR